MAESSPAGDQGKTVLMMNVSLKVMKLFVLSFLLSMWKLIGVWKFFPNS